MAVSVEGVVCRERAWLEDEGRQEHDPLRQSIPEFLRNGSLRNLLSTPLVYSIGMPLLLLDLWVTMYQWICFPIYGISRVRRRPYFVVDRHKLPYLNLIEKFNCAYCTYAIGALAYVREVAACTEQYWCPIKHAGPIPSPHEHYQLFFDYGDAAGYHGGLAAVRQALRRRRTPPR